LIRAVSVVLEKLFGSEASVPPGAGKIAVAGISADSRTVKPNYLFAALPGTKVDGASFIPAALESGAVAVLCAADAAVPEGTVAVRAGNPHRALSLAAAIFFGAQPDVVVAVTGTNGKTSVTAFVRQIWEKMGFRAASLGTIGVVGPAGGQYLAHTTPDPVTLHQTLAALARDHVTHLAIEASSHGLAQYRLDGVRLAAGAFTNLTRDHLDYHASFADYFAAKMRLFTELLPEGAPAVINADSPHAREAIDRAVSQGLRAVTVGVNGRSLKLVSSRREGFGQALEVGGPKKLHRILLPLVGDFQASNALVAAGLAIATGGDEDLVMNALESLKGARGRLELVASTAAGAPVFVDYAHSPDALEHAIKSLRPYVNRKLSVVFGCGGDRDKGKRPQMGAIAAKFADRSYVTDDNPRGEPAETIRAQIMAACPGAIEIGDRAKAIATAIADLGGGDVLLVAGKGHEEGQIVGSKVIPFSDHAAVEAAVRGAGSHG
jgi:UDP-N-acetylmuramoyl-L-alanyl-D-glutamate--2,6-diaminopimelate ligase